MALSRVKVWTAEVLTYADLNAEFNNILNNANSLISPLVANLDGDGFTILDLGGLIVGRTASSVTAGSAHATQLHGTSAATGGAVIGMFSADAVAPTIAFAKSRNATIGSHTIVQSGDDIGAITAYGSDGTDFEPAAQILFECGGTPGNNDMPGAIVLYTTPDGSVTLTERVRINSAGGVLIASLTSGRVPYASTSGLLTDSANLTFDGTTFAVATASTGTSNFSTTGTSPGMQVTQGNGTATLPTARWANTATSGDNLWMEWYTEAGGVAGTLRGTIDYNRAGGAVRYNTSSDYRAKDLFGPYLNANNALADLKVYEGLMKGATQRRPMLVAHEAQEVAPYAVSGAKDAENEDGTPKMQGIDHSAFVPLLIAGLQEANARIAALEAKLA